MAMTDLQHDLVYSDSEEIENDIAVDEIPQEERKLRTQAYDKSISDVVSMIDRGDIILNPEYQRNYVWDNKKASLLIESILLNVPIPVIYVSEEEDSCWNVVDGLQRLNSLHRFFADEFKLKGLEVLQELNGIQYSKLSPKASRILRNGNLRIILIFKESHPEIKYDIFMRLNRGAIHLNNQELRNCLYRGSLNDLLKELRQNRQFLSILRLSEPHKRMTDAEMILRYFMISENYNFDLNELSKEYTGKITSSLNKYCAKYQNASPEVIERLKSKFDQTVEKVYQVFGKNAFRKINEDGTYDRNRLNRAIIDIVMISFEHFSADDLKAKKDKIINLLRELPIKDAEFNNAITIATSDRKKLEYRLSIWCCYLQKLINS